MLLSSIVDPSAKKPDVHYLVLHYNGARDLIPMPRDYPELQEAMRELYEDDDGEFQVETGELNICCGDRVRVTKKAWDGMAHLLGNLHVSRKALAARRVPVDAPPNPNVPVNSELVVRETSPRIAESSAATTSSQDDSQWGSEGSEGDSAEDDYTEATLLSRQAVSSPGPAPAPNPKPNPRPLSVSFKVPSESDSKSPRSSIYTSSDTIRYAPPSPTGAVRSLASREDLRLLVPTSESPASISTYTSHSNSVSYKPSPTGMTTGNTSVDASDRITISIRYGSRLKHFRLKNTLTVQKLVTAVCRQYELEDPSRARLFAIRDHGEEFCYPSTTVFGMGVSEGQEFELRYDEY